MATATIISQYSYDEYAQYLEVQILVTDGRQFNQLLISRLNGVALTAQLQAYADAYETEILAM